MLKLKMQLTFSSLLLLLIFLTGGLQTKMLILHYIPATGIMTGLIFTMMTMACHLKASTLPLLNEGLLWTPGGLRSGSAVRRRDSLAKLMVVMSP